ncbi:MAG: ABC transporter permease [Scytolyngbya sp. HA4215-MV1]|jgi:ABC-2 type transport system permease protein|nr:ABC transporter permease [Scytolyngbya sp. HA4215-MV1]
MRVIFSNILAIYRKELQTYFASPLAAAIAGIFWFLSGVLFVRILFNATLTATQFDAQGQQIDLPSAVLQDFLGVLGFISLFILPMLSMSLYAEERKRGTLELLATSPITNWAVALGKLLAVLTFYISLVLPLMAYEAIVFSSTNPPFSPAVFLIGHAGLILLSAAILSLGMFISSLTDSTILAAILTFVLTLLLWLTDALAGNSGLLGDIFGQLSLLKHFTNLVQGVVDTSSLILFASYTVLGLFLTAQSVEAFRFQRS